MNTSHRVTLALLLAASFVSAPTPAQEPYLPLPPPSIRATAEAIVTVRPDRAEIDIGVVSQARESQAAAAQNARQLEAVLGALRKQLGLKTDIRTISYSLQPNYRYPKEGGEPTIDGYVAMNTVRVTLDDLGRVGTAIDAATGAGANQVQRIQFVLKDEQSARAQALREAAIKARNQTDALAGALGLAVRRVLSVVDAGPIVQPVPPVMMSRAEAADGSTPIVPGTIEVRATVTVMVEVSAR